MADVVRAALEGVAAGAFEVLVDDARAVKAMLAGPPEQMYGAMVSQEPGSQTA